MKIKSPYVRKKYRTLALGAWMFGALCTYFACRSALDASWRDCAEAGAVGLVVTCVAVFMTRRWLG